MTTKKDFIAAAKTIAAISEKSERNEQNNHIFYSYYEARKQAILKAIELISK